MTAMTKIGKFGLDDFQAPGAGSVGRNPHDKLGDIVNVKDKGGKLNGVDDDSAALMSAIMSLPAYGGTIEWTGHLRLNSKFVFPTARAGVRLAPRGGYVYAPAHGFDFMELPAGTYDYAFDRVKFLSDGVAPGATERWCLLNACDNFRSHNLEAQNIFSFMKATGPKCVLQGRTLVTATKPLLGRGLVIDQGASELFKVEDFLGNNGTDSLSAIDVVSGNQIELGGGAYKSGNVVRVVPGVGQIVATLDFRDWNSDTSQGNGVWFSGVGAIQRVRGSIIASSNGGDGVRVDNIPHSAEDVLVRSIQNAVRGLHLGAGDHKNGRYRLTAFGNGTHGFNAVAGAVSWSVDAVSGDGDGFGGNGSYGAVVGAGCDHISLDLKGRGNGIALLYSDTAVSSTAQINTRG